MSILLDKQEIEKPSWFDEEEGSFVWDHPEAVFEEAPIDIKESSFVVFISKQSAIEGFAQFTWDVPPIHDEPIKVSLESVLRQAKYEEREHVYILGDYLKIVDVYEILP